MRPAAPWLRQGLRTPELLWSALAVIAVSVLALTLWTMLFDPPAPPFVTSLGE